MVRRPLQVMVAISGISLNVTEVDLGLYLSGGELGGLIASLENSSSGSGR